MTGRKISLDELPRYSPWPARLLGLEPWSQKVKSREEIDREYEVESWGAYLERVRKEGIQERVTEELLDDWQCPKDTPVAFSRGGDLVVATFREAYREYLDAVRSRVAPHLPAPAVVELGCGYGSVILFLAGQREFSGTSMMAAEYTVSGQELTRICAANRGVRLHVGRCDFTAERLTDLTVPEGSVIFTCVSACTLPSLPRSFVPALLALAPAAVIHLEPVYEHQKGRDLLSLLRRRYVEVNDYNRNLLTLLKEAEASGEIEIFGEERRVVGVNPLFPVSVVSWRPAREKHRKETREAPNPGEGYVENME